MLTVFLVAVAPRSAEASDGKSDLPRRVALDVGACPDVSAAALRRIMTIEIGDLLVGPSETVSGDTDRVVIACTGALAQVRADGPGRPRALERALALDDFPGDAAPRALALAAIEILAVLSPDVRERIEARQRPRTPVPAPPLVSAPASTAPPPPRRATFAVVASAVYRTFFTSHPIAAWGGRLGFRYDLGSRWEIGADGEVANASTSGTLGSISSTLASGAAFLGVRGGGPHLTGGLGLGGRAGIARFEGRPAQGVIGEHASHPWGGPILAARARASVGHVGLELLAELGFDLGKANGTEENRTVVTIGGPWLALSAGIGFRF